jgi:hypothetical protein
MRVVDFAIGEQIKRVNRKLIVKNPLYVLEVEALPHSHTVEIAVLVQWSQQEIKERVPFSFVVREPNGQLMAALDAAGGFYDNAPKNAIVIITCFNECFLSFNDEGFYSVSVESNGKCLESVSFEVKRKAVRL